MQQDLLATREGLLRNIHPLIEHGQDPPLDLPADDADRMNKRRASLLEAARSRWSGAASQVYVRGMLVGFLTDLAMLEASKGKRSLTDLLREVYTRHRKPNPRAEGNAAVLAILGSRPELQPIVAKYIKGTDDIEWKAALDAAGISVSTVNSSSKLSVVPKPGGRQKELLDKLGYNNWRKNP